MAFSTKGLPLALCACAAHAVVAAMASAVVIRRTAASERRLERARLKSYDEGFTDGREYLRPRLVPTSTAGRESAFGRAAK